MAGFAVYWEFVIYFQKLILLVAVIFMNDLNEGVQICLICFLLWIYMAIQARNMPYFSKTLNLLQTAVFLLCTSFFIARLIIRNYDLQHTTR